MNDDVQPILASAGKAKVHQEDDAVPTDSLIPNYFKLMFDEQAEGLMSEKLDKIWRQFVERIGSLEITDFISFQLLAGCLEELAKKHGVKPFRTFPTRLKQGSQNLVICPNAEMHTLALSYYMLDSTKRLPCLDEVLMCQNDTTRDQVTASSFLTILSMESQMTIQ